MHFDNTNNDILKSKVGVNFPKFNSTYLNGQYQNNFNTNDFDLNKSIKMEIKPNKLNKSKLESISSIEKKFSKNPNSTALNSSWSEFHEK